MRPRGLEAYPTGSTPETSHLSPEETDALNGELRRLATETSAHWGAFQDCRGGQSPKLNDAARELAASCEKLIAFMKALETRGIGHLLDENALAMAGEEYWMACELLGKVIK